VRTRYRFERVSLSSWIIRWETADARAARSMRVPSPWPPVRLSINPSHWQMELCNGALRRSNSPRNLGVRPRGAPMQHAGRRRAARAQRRPCSAVANQAVRGSTGHRVLLFLLCAAGIVAPWQTAPTSTWQRLTSHRRLQRDSRRSFESRRRLLDGPARRLSW
jgi:hypothetical protein